MVTGYCEPEDVRQALQRESLSGSVDITLVEPDILAVSDWLRKQSGRHWYDSSLTDATAVVADGPRTATNVRLDVPASAHAHDRQIHFGESGVRYPVSSDGPYCRLPLAHAFVSTISGLRVRQRDGSVVDWTADPDKQAGRGADYYLREHDQEGYGRSVLRVHERSIGPRIDFGGLIEVDYEFGLDAADEPWQDVRRGVANMVAAQVIVEDDVLTAIPDNGQLIGVDTKAERLLTRGEKYLEPYIEVSIT